jgi:hypothetical protein
MVIEPQFEEGEGFRNGRALVWPERAYPWVFIDTSGKTMATLGEKGDSAFAPSFGGKPEFVDGRALFSQNNPETFRILHGYMDENGKKIIPPRYKNAKPFSEGLAAVQLDIDSMNNWAFIDYDGNIAMERRFYDVLPFKDGLALVQTYTDAGTREEYIDKQGETVLVLPKEGQVYRYGKDFEVMLCTGHNQCGIQDMAGNWIIQPIFPPLDSFSEGLAVFTATYKSEQGYGLRSRNVAIRRVGAGVINRQGETVVKMGIWLYIGAFTHGFAPVYNSPNDKWQYIDINGSLVENYLLPIGEPSYGLQLVLNKDGYGFVRVR